jgi:UDPglucose 6-dehydrogenase
MKIAVLGTGYVGLVCGACLAGFGHSVTCVDVDAKKIKSLQHGRVPFFEPGLETLVAEQSRAGRLTFTTDAATAIRSAKAVFLSVGTPPGDRGEADLSFVYECARTIAAYMRGYTVVVTKSTVPLGTAEEVEAIIRKERPGGSFAVVSNPEFMREGSAVQDFMSPDRVVIGAEEEPARKIMMQLYRPFQQNGVPIVCTSRRTAELLKYAANAFLAAKIAFIGELSDVCEQANADIADVALGIGLDPRIGPQFLQPGPGFGGSCFPKDALALATTARRFGTPSRIVEAVIAANEARKRAMVAKIVASFGGEVSGKRIAVLGLTFKPNTDDLREAASLVIVPMLEEMGASLRVYDPAGMKQARKLMPGLRTAKDPYDCVRESDALVILTDWDEFKRLDLERVKAELRAPLVIDLRNIYDPQEMIRRGFDYVGLGRAAAIGASDGRALESTVPAIDVSLRVLPRAAVRRASNGRLHARAATPNGGALTARSARYRRSAAAV